MFFFNFTVLLSFRVAENFIPMEFTNVYEFITNELEEKFFTKIIITKYYGNFKILILF